MLGPADFIELEHLAGHFTTKNHHRFLSEAIACLRRTRDPVAVLELLTTMQGDASKDEAAALNDILTWFLSQLRGRPVHLNEVELRLAWARRLSRIAEAAGRERFSRGDEPRQAPTPRLRVTEQELRQLRQRYPDPARLPALPTPPQLQHGVPAGPSPTPNRPPLPAYLAVMFEDHRKAMDTLKRLASPSKGRPGTPIRVPGPIPLAPPPGGPPFPPDLGPIVLSCSAVGIGSYINALHTVHHGSAFPFYVAALEHADDGSRVLARELLLAPPAPAAP